MSSQVFLVFSLYCLINAFTPGPGNILALSTITNYGWTKGKPLFFGIFTGYYIVQVLCAFFVFGIGVFLPDFLGIMKYIGALYILWLAVTIAISKPDTEIPEQSASFMKGFLLQFVNVKIWLFGITALTGYITDQTTAFMVLLGAELAIATLGTIATCTWIGMGVLIQKFYLRHYRMLNIIMALTLIQCIYSILTG